ATFDLDPSADATIWVKQVDDPRAFGVVNLNASNRIESFEEKPQNPKSDLAIIGVYHFKDAADIRREMQHLIDHDIRSKGEYQLTDALEQLRQKGTVFVPGVVNQWMDCGNKAITVKSNAQMLDIKAAQGTLVMQGSVKNSVLIEPVYIEEGCVIENSVVGPHVTLGKNTVINNSLVANSLVQHDTEIVNASIEGSMIGSKCSVHGKVADLSIGDYTTIQL
ncbi:MAG: sugar phosphate nucleotidyltransferase, partial [Bacteroidota bacterium]|nr:sugar phosphate nucleotidyltransferase [Bacteroidota bacterium]